MEAGPMVATVVTAEVSNRSAAMPAQSPTLSPTLSAMVAGLRGSSSGMPASTLPTRSPPTSAPLVKMPPPRRGEMGNSGGPEPGARGGAPSHRQAGPGAAANRHRQAFAERAGRGLRGAHVRAHRHQHADEARSAR